MSDADFDLGGSPSVIDTTVSDTRPLEEDNVTLSSLSIFRGGRGKWMGVYSTRENMPLNKLS